MAGVVFFDIDGTLTSAAVSSSAAHLASLTGNAERVIAAEAAYARGELSNADVCAVDAAGFAGVSVDQVDRWLDDLPVIDGIVDVVDGCCERGLTPVLASGASGDRAGAGRLRGDDVLDPVRSHRRSQEGDGVERASSTPADADLGDRWVSKRLRTHRSPRSAPRALGVRGAGSRG